MTAAELREMENKNLVKCALAFVALTGKTGTIAYLEDIYTILKELEKRDM